MKYRLFITVSCILLAAPGFPCGNSYHPSSNADEYTAGSRLESFRFKQAFSRGPLMNELTQLTDAINAQLNLFENENDQALTCMRLGRYDEAMAILEKLEKEKPGEYNIIANLGTLFELRGENEKALAYIQKAVSINAESHHGSEWFHIKILQAKLQHKEDEWWTTHAVLDIPAVKKEPEIIISDLVYQLKERLPFTPAPNELMAAVLNETAAYLQQQKKNEQAWIIYKIAVGYDHKKLFGFEKKIASAEKYFKENNIPQPDISAHYIAAGELIENGANLLEKGLGMYNRYQERAKEKEQAEKRKKTIYIISVSGVILALGLFLYRNFRKKNNGDPVQ